MGTQKEGAYSLPFGAQYFVDSKIDSPGPVKKWNWKPKNKIIITQEEASSWPGTTGTGPDAKGDEIYSENQ